MHKYNILKLTFRILSILGIILIIPTMGASVSIIAIASLFWITDILSNHKTLLYKNRIAITYWLVILVWFFQTTKSVTLHVSGEPSNIFIITDIPNQETIHSNWKWNKHVEVDSTYIILTSSSNSQIPRIVIENRDGQHINNGAIGSLYGNCKSKSTILYLGTIHTVKQYQDSIDNNWSEEARRIQLINCMN